MVSEVALGILGSLLSALLTGVISWFVARYQIREMKEDYEKQLHTYRQSVDSILENSNENMRKMFFIIDSQERKITDYHNHLIAIAHGSKDLDSRKIDLHENEVDGKQRNCNVKIMRDLRKAFGGL